MFRAIGVILILFTVAHLLGGAFRAFETALVETFGAFEAAAIQSQKQFTPGD